MASQLDKLVISLLQTSISLLLLLLPNINQQEGFELVSQALQHLQGFPGGSDGKASACSAGDPGSIPGLGRSPGEGNGNPLTPVLLPGKFHGWSLVRCSPWGNKESDTTERLHFTADKKLGLSQRGGFAPGWISPGGSSKACSPLLKVGVWAEHTWLTLGAENS